MARTAQAAGLIDVTVDERAVDVGVIEPEQLVGYRGQAQYTAWLDQIGPSAPTKSDSEPQTWLAR